MVGMLLEVANKIVLWPRLASFQGPSQHKQTNADFTLISKPPCAAEGKDHRKPQVVKVQKTTDSGARPQLGHLWRKRGPEDGESQRTRKSTF